ncbi:MAG TPA: transaldolase family protein [Anaerolineaceae bacterium]|nr:transaldolase family protein [Anaerolineaceae bacterium]
MEAVTYKSPLHQMIITTACDYWNDSCSIEELTYAIENGAVGATTNPTIVGEVLKKEMPLWRERIEQIIRENPTWNEDAVTWKLIEEMAARGAGLLRPIYEREGHLKGRISIQTDPKNYRNAEALVAQAVHFSTIAPNLHVKIPVTKAGVEAIEEVTCRGVNINATVSFSVPQAIAVAEAVERGLDRRQAEGKDISEMAPVCTIMIGRLDDWIQVLVKRDGIVTNPGHPHWAGLACFKKAYGLYQARAYRTRLLSAAYRHHLHWSELIGGDVVQTITYAWQKAFNTSDIEVTPRMQNPVDPDIVAQLYRKFLDFRRAYDEDGLTLAEFDTFGPTVRTLRQFISSYADLASVIRDFMLPNPDVK